VGIKNFNVVAWLGPPALRNEWRDVVKFPGRMLIPTATQEPACTENMDYKAPIPRKHWCKILLHLSSPAPNSFERKSHSLKVKLLKDSRI
jgi:hypothetical protein